jgi:hypothetical protein
MHLSLFNKILIPTCACIVGMLFSFTRSPKGDWYGITKQEVTVTCQQSQQQKSNEVKQVAQELCGCVVGKLEQKYSPNQLNDLKEDELDRMGMLCLSGDSLATRIHLLPQSQWKLTEKIAFIGSCRDYLRKHNHDGEYNRLNVLRYCNCLAEQLETQPYTQVIGKSPELLITIMKGCK